MNAEARSLPTPPVRPPDPALRPAPGGFRGVLEQMAQYFALVRLVHDEAGAVVDVEFVDANAALRDGGFGDVRAGLRARDAYPSLDPAWLEIHDRVVRTRRAERHVRFEPVLQRWFDVQLVPFDDADPTLLALLFDDVTARRRAEADLRASEERLRLSQEAGHVGVFEWDIAADTTWWSPAQWRLFRHDAATAHGDPSRLFRAAVHPDDAAGLDAEVARCLAGEVETIRHELRIVRPDGAVRWIDVVAGITARDAAGAPVRVAGVNIDVTDRVLVERALRDTEERFRIMADGLPHIVWVHDEVGALRFVNRTYLDFFGVTPTQVMGEGWLPLTHPDDGPSYAEEFLACVAEHRPFHASVRVRDARGAWRTIESWGRPRIAADGTYLGHVGTSVDVTERNAAEEALREADRRKDEFLAMLAHELRNPLAPVRHAVELMRRAGGGDALVQRSREIIERQVAHMARLIDDLLDVSRIARGRVQLRLEPVDLAEVVRQTTESYRATVTGAGLALELALPPAELPVLGDATRLSQVLGNLLHNAAKFTPRGGRVAVGLAADGDEAMLTVADTGIGIAPALLGTLFEPFAQGEQSLDRAHGGLGLGLALVKGLTEMHGGRVAVHSDGEGTGTCFTLHLPLVPAAVVRAPAAVAAVAAAPMRVLVVEDNADAAEMLRALLALSGHEVRIARDGAGGVTEARAWRPDAIVCDLGLPGTLDGYGVARAVRDEPALRDTWLVALSGYGQANDMDRTRAAGFDRHLVKPAAYATLAAALVRDGEPALSTPASPGT